MYNGSDCDRTPQLSDILTEPLNPRDIVVHMIYATQTPVLFLD